MIEVTNVSKSYGAFQALEDVSFTVDRGRAAALWGRNGAGKTTTIRCILGVTSFQGAIRVGGVDVAERGVEARRMLGYVPQHLPRFDMPVGELAAFMARIRGTDTKEARIRLDEVGLLAHAGKDVQALSGGMRQRLALALARLGDPPVLLLDEPTASLDTYGRDELFELLEDVRGRGITILFASHRPDEIDLLADEVLWMEDGRLRERLDASTFGTRRREGAPKGSLIRLSERIGNGRR